MGKGRGRVIGTYVSVREFDSTGDNFSRVLSGVRCNPTVIYRNHPTDSATTLVVMTKERSNDMPTCERVGVCRVV